VLLVVIEAKDKDSLLSFRRSNRRAAVVISFSDSFCLDSYSLSSSASFFCCVKCVRIFSLEVLLARHKAIAKYITRGQQTEKKKGETIDRVTLRGFFFFSYQI
jgi:hypothetical protein